MSTYPPDRWERFLLSDVLADLPSGSKLQQGWSPQCEKVPAEHDQWGVLKTTAIQPGAFLPEHNKRLPAHQSPRAALEVVEGDLLLTNAGPRSRCGIPCLVRSTRPRLMLSGKIYRFRPRPDLIDSRFLEFYLLSPDAQAALDAMKTGISDSGLNLTRGRFLALAVPVPPMEEQWRIVEILEDHLSRLDAATAYAASAGEKQARLVNRHLSAAIANLGAPRHRIGELLSEPLTNGRSIPTADEGFPVLRLTALQRGRVNLEARKTGAWTATEAAPFLVHQHDFLISRGNGSKQLVGVGGLVIMEPDPVAFPDTMIRIRPRAETLDPSFLALVWNAPDVRQQIEAAAKTTAGIYKINQKDVKRLCVPIPTIEQQAALVADVSVFAESVDRLDRARERSLSRSRALRRSLLAAAFSGRLT